ncbi:MAG: hypothetical protein ABTD50_14645, partial [Polyangiaceae bacterium]
MTHTACVVESPKGEFQSSPSEAGGESRGAYFLCASTLDAGIARVAPGVAPRGSHGSGRAELPHPALRVTGLLR